MKICGVVLLGLLLVFHVSVAQTPRTISYQGVLCDATGKPKPDATHSMTFRLYDAESQGTLLWTEQKNLDTRRGLFSTQLGSQVLFGPNLTFDKRYWLSIQVGSEAELSPRIPLSSAGYSFYSGKADTAANALGIRDSAVTSVKIASRQVVRSINTLKDEVTLVAGSNVSITPSGNTLTITANGGGGGTVTGSGSSGQVAFWTGSSGLGGDNGAIWDNVNKHLGIGTTSPQSALHLGSGRAVINSSAQASWGQLQIGNPTADGAATISLFNNSGPIAYGDDPVASTKWTIGLNAALVGGKTFALSNDLLNEATPFAVSYSGNVGIGTPAPTSKLEVAGGSILFSGSTGETPVSGNGRRMMWIPSKAAFRAGEVDGPFWDDASIGLNSIAMGYSTVASGPGTMAMGDHAEARSYGTVAIGFHALADGPYSIAMGNNTNAHGTASTAMGGSTIASGHTSTAMGNHTYASGEYSTAMGFYTTAGGHLSTAMGNYTTASGQNSTAMGNNVSTDSHAGAFIIGDASTISGTTPLVSSSAANQLMAVFGGGYTLYTSRNMGSGVYMDGGTSGWTNISDRNKKENFCAIDGEEVLTKIRSMSIAEWNYKGSDPSIRYIGPVAQEFYAAFHLGGTDSLGINSICIDGVNMAAIQALEKRTAELRDKTAELHAKTAELEMVKSELADVKTRLNRLEEVLSSPKSITQRVSLESQR